jgi:hypothetical protein
LHGEADPFPLLSEAGGVRLVFIQMDLRAVHKPQAVAKHGTEKLSVDHHTLP